MTTPPPACDLAVVFAVAIEADAFARLATDAIETRAGGLVIHDGRIAGSRVAWCTGGVGAVAAAHAARLLVAGHRPRRLVTAGFGGGLDPALPRGALVRPTLSISEASAIRLPLDPGPGSGAAAGELTIVSVAEIVSTAAAKAELAARTGGRVVDMETHAVAREAAAAGLPCAAVRVISDAANDELPREVAALARPQSPMRRLGAAVGALGRRPRAALDLWRLYEHAVVDAKTLAAALGEICAASRS